MPQNIVCETSVRSQGNMDFRFGAQEEVAKNRTAFLQAYGISYTEHIAMRCDHTDIITLVSSFHPSVGATSQEDQLHSEVLITQEKNLALMLFTADCQPTSFYDPQTQTIALAHISRQTLCNDLSSKTIAFLKEELCVEPNNLRVHIGPSIQKESYAFPLPLSAPNSKLTPFTEEENGRAHVDLIGAHLFELQSLGVSKENITVSDHDTATTNYFSYYISKQKGLPDEGRMATILMMR